MSIVIVGGHDRMVCQYKKICKGYNCKAKVFTQMSAELGKRSEGRICWYCLRTLCPIRW